VIWWSSALAYKDGYQNFYSTKVNGALIDDNWDGYTKSLKFTGGKDLDNWTNVLLPILNNCRERLFPKAIRLLKPIEVGEAIDINAWPTCVSLFTEEEELRILDL